MATPSGHCDIERLGAAFGGGVTMAFITVDGCRLSYEATGEGPPVIFAHECAADARQWRGQVAALSGQYRCIVYNARGYPPSDVPEDDAAYGYIAAWRDLAAIVDEVAGGPAHIVGLSMGAYAALMVGLHRPEIVRSLFLAGGGGGSIRQPTGAMAARMADLARLFTDQGAVAGAREIASHPNRTGFRRRDPAGWQVWYDDLAGHSALGTALTVRNYQGHRPSLYTFEDALRRLDRPVQLAVGEEDAPCVEINRFLAQTLPDAALWIVPDAGHAINLEAPEAFNSRLAAFLTQAGGKMHGAG
jgi:pimeloyl-ACP methyl ester carboxylesterase